MFILLLSSVLCRCPGTYQSKLLYYPPSRLTRRDAVPVALSILSYTQRRGTCGTVHIILHPHYVASKNRATMPAHTNKRTTWRQSKWSALNRNVAKSTNSNQYKRNGRFIIIVILCDTFAKRPNRKPKNRCLHAVSLAS